MTTLTQHRQNPDHHHPYGPGPPPAWLEPLSAGAAAVAGGGPLVTQSRPIVWQSVTMVVIQPKKTRMTVDVKVCSALTTTPATNPSVLAVG